VLKLALTTNQSIKCYIFSETKIPDTRINEAAQDTINIILWGASGLCLLILLIRVFISGIQKCRRRNQTDLDLNSKYFKSVHVLLRSDFCTEIIHVYTVPYNDVRYDFGIKTMFGSSLPSVCGRDCVLFTLFVFVAYSGVQHILCCVFVFFFFVLCDLCCQLLSIALLYSLAFTYSPIR
jgi:hypothetical protein